MEFAGLFLVIIIVLGIVAYIVSTVVEDTLKKRARRILETSTYKKQQLDSLITYLGQRHKNEECHHLCQKLLELRDRK